MLLSSVCVLSHVRLFATPWTVPTRLLCPLDSPGKNTGVGGHALLKWILFEGRESEGRHSHSLMEGNDEKSIVVLLLNEQNLDWRQS